MLWSGQTKNQQRIHEHMYRLGKGTEGGRGENKQERGWSNFPQVQIGKHQVYRRRDSKG